MISLARMEVMASHVTARTIALFGIFAFLVSALFFLYSGALPPAVSAELGIAALSPAGELGGRVVPASCPSYAHIAGECSPTFTGSGSSGGSGTSFSINEGDTVTLEWSCVNSDSSSGVNFSTGGAVSGGSEEQPTDDVSYTLVCSNGGQATVNVTVLHPELSITAVPRLVRPGDTSTITWSTTNTNSCTVTGPNFNKTGLSGSQSSGPITHQSTYVLTCQTDAGPTSESVTVNVTPTIIEE